MDNMCRKRPNHCLLDGKGSPFKNKVDVGNLFKNFSGKMRLLD